MVTMRFLLALPLTAALVAPAFARESRRMASATPAEVQDVLAAEAAGLVDVKFIPNDSRSAQVIVTNRSDRPLSLRLPAGFAGVPVLAQMGMQGGGAGGFGAGGIGVELQRAISFTEFDTYLAILLLIIACITVIDLVSERLRHRLIGAMA